MNMAGKDAVHQGSVNMNVLDTIGLISSSYGLWMGVDGGEASELYDADRYRYLNLQFQEPRPDLPPPRLGEHSRDVLSERLDLAEPEIDRLFEEGVTGTVLSRLSSDRSS